MPSVLLIIDKYGWSYDTIAKGIVEHNHDANLVIDIVSASEDGSAIESRHAHYDLIFVMGWTDVCSKSKKTRLERLLPFIAPERIVTGIHSHRSFDDYRTMPDACPPPPPALVEQLNKLRGVNAVSRRLYNLFSDAGLRNIYLTENGVDTDLFRPLASVDATSNKPLAIGFSGSTAHAKHDFLKGYSAFIQPLGELRNVQLRLLGGRGDGQVARADMPQLYNEIDVYICASTSEGFSQSVLEASACGRMVLSTKVGGSEELIMEGISGFFIERDLDALKQQVLLLEGNRPLVAELGANNRRRVLSHYSWDVRAQDWLGFINSNLPGRTHAAMSA